MGSSAFWPLILFFFRTKPNKAWRDLRRAYRRYPTLGTGYVFPHLRNVVCSPALDTCIFCHARHCSTLTSITNTPTFLSFLSGRRKKSTCYLTYLVRKATLTRFFPPRPFDSKPRPTFTALGNRPAHSMA